MVESDTLTKYDVWLRSVPGPYEQYDGKVTVFAEDQSQAIDRAFRELQRGAFRDRVRAMWRVEGVQVCG